MKTKTSKLVALFFAILTLFSIPFISNCSKKDGEQENLPFEITKKYPRYLYNSSNPIMSTYWVYVDVQNLSNDSIEIYMLYNLAGKELKSDTVVMEPQLNNGISNRVYHLRVQIPEGYYDAMLGVGPKNEDFEFIWSIV